jgi:hypothetical protein
MRAVVVYESMYGNTHLIADRIGAALAADGVDVFLTNIEGAKADMVSAADLVVVGGPTHVHAMTSARSRDAAVQAVEKDPDLALDPDAEGPGLRDWFDALGPVEGTKAAAFDTRMDASPLLTGRASKGIARRLRKHGFVLVTEPESFLVDKHNHLLDHQAEAAEAWGRALASTLQAEPTRSS